MNNERDSEAAIAILALGRVGRLRTVLLDDLRDRVSRTAARIAASDLVESVGIAPMSVNGSLSEARRLIESGLELGIVPIPITSVAYPLPLAAISDAPSILFARGSLSVLGLIPGAAVVGTRKATRHGLTIAERIATYLSDNGWVVVSGLALGIDAAAHEGAMRGSAPTIAVLAHGLERASPRANEPLAMRILDKGGLWVSEHPVGAVARPENFVLRNRIQVGLSAGSVIVEGALQSGSMTQAEFCLRNKRELFAVLPDGSGPVETQSELPRMLVRDRGAVGLASRDDYSKMLELLERRRALLTGPRAEPPTG